MFDVCVSARPKKSLAKLAKLENFLLAKWENISPIFLRHINRIATAGGVGDHSTLMQHFY